MKVTGIIAEYNPFHTGHAYQIREAKKQTGADYIIVVMSPDFVQRGEPAVFDKYTRAEMALLNGADLVVELPLCYAVGSAEYFAEGAVIMLEKLGVTDVICFGTEHTEFSAGSFRSKDSDASEAYMNTAAFFLNESPEYQKAFKGYLLAGNTIPKARMLAMQDTASPEEAEMMTALMSSPNAILGIEYCKALLKLDSSIKPFPIQRIGSGYHDDSLVSEYSSATAIRNVLSADADSVDASDSQAISRFIPSVCHALFEAEKKKVITMDDFQTILYSKLIGHTAADYKEIIYDLNSDLADRLFKQKDQLIGHSYADALELLKTKQITQASVRRALLHLMLSLKKTDIEQFRSKGSIFYTRILGFGKDASPLLHEIKQKTSVPVITRLANAEKQLGPEGQIMLKQDIDASHLYHMVQSTKYRVPYQNEYTRSVLH